MIYLDTSVLLAELLAEDRHPPPALWEEPLVSSRLLEFEVWTRLHSRRLAASHGEAARALLSRVALLELVSPVLTRALDPFPKEVRTLDALHLASIDFLRERSASIRLATYDARQAGVASVMGIEVYSLG
jgi:predicted nucleic acid-binding protein